MSAEEELLASVQEVLNHNDIDGQSRSSAAILSALVVLARHIDKLHTDIYNLQKHEDIAK